MTFTKKELINLFTENDILDLPLLICSRNKDKNVVNLLHNITHNYVLLSIQSPLQSTNPVKVSEFIAFLTTLPDNIAFYCETSSGFMKEIEKIALMKQQYKCVFYID